MVCFFRPTHRHRDLLPKSLLDISGYRHVTPGGEFLHTFDTDGDVVAPILDVILTEDDTGQHLSDGINLNFSSDVFHRNHECLNFWNHGDIIS